MQSDRLRLLEILREKSVSYGDYTLSSGKKSVYYVDSKLTTFDSRGVSLVGKLVFEIIKEKDKAISAVGGLTMGADPITISTIIAALNENYHLKGFSVRKEEKRHGKRKLIEGNIDVEDKVVILDDVITTGGSTVKAIKAVREFGCDIIMVIALVDRLEGGTEKIEELGYEVCPIFTINELLDSQKLGEVSSNGNTQGSNIFIKQRVFRKQPT